MTLIDTSSWIHSLRPHGDPTITSRVRILLEQGEAAWCPMVRLELWAGARGDQEKTVLREMEHAVPELEVDAVVWQKSVDLARKARRAGKTVPATDILISACAAHHGVDLEHCDTDFDVLAAL
jgi:predicted nucleic acid-binding protein